MRQYHLDSLDRLLENLRRRLHSNGFGGEHVISANGRAKAAWAREAQAIAEPRDDSATRVAEASWRLQYLPALRVVNVKRTTIGVHQPDAMEAFDITFVQSADEGVGRWRLLDEGAARYKTRRNTCAARGEYHDHESVANAARAATRPPAVPRTASA